MAVELNREIPVDSLPAVDWLVPPRWYLHWKSKVQGVQVSAEFFQRFEAERPNHAGEPWLLYLYISMIAAGPSMPDRMLGSVAEQFGGTVNLSLRKEVDLTDYLPIELCARYFVVPYWREGPLLLVAALEPTVLPVLDQARVFLWDLAKERAKNGDHRMFLLPSVVQLLLARPPTFQWYLDRVTQLACSNHGG